MKKLLIYTIILCLFGFICTLALTADTQKDFHIEINASTSQVTVGDSLSIFCAVTIPSGVKANEPYLKDKSPSLDIEKQWEETETTDSGFTTEHYGFLVYVFAPDSLSIGPFIVEYVTADGESGSVLSDTISLTVTGVVENPESPPLPNRNPLEIVSKGIPVWLIILIISLIIIIALTLAYFIYRKKTTSKPIPQKPIDEIGEFERIRKLKLYESGRSKDLYILISRAMRGFIHRNMEFDAIYETTEEIFKNLSKTSGDTTVTGTISEILEESDKVKFAKYTPPSGLSSSLIDRAIEPVKAVLDEIARKKEQESTAKTETEIKTSAKTSSVQSGR